MKKLRIYHLAILFIFLLQPTSVFPQYQEIYNAVQEKIKSELESGVTHIGNDLLYTPDRLNNYYSKHNYEPLWFQKENREELIEIIRNAYVEGLNPTDYHLERIEDLENQMTGGNRDIDLLANLELLLSDAVVLYSYHLLWGKVDQSKIRKDWDIPENPKPAGLDSLFANYKYNNNLTEFFERLKPRHYMYVQLREGLKLYRNIAENGGWPSIPDGEVLKPGMTNERIPVIREYLTVTGDLQTADLVEDSVATLFDKELEQAVKTFQFRHNLSQDGVIGKGTLAQINVPVEKRMDMIRVNMERARWVLQQLEPDFLVVNIAGFNIRRVKNDSIVFFSPVIVGRLHHESPVFKGKMTYIELNPTWTLPYSIATKETLPKLQKDPSYLAKKNMIIMDRDGKKLDPSTIDFSKYSRGNFPFIIRQEPGPHNALGQVKFMFPNKYSVYLHDTPARSLFSREDRAFSHGCIRLDKKWGLLMNLMNEPDVWNMEKINEIIKTEKTTRITLPQPIDIVILYWTAGADKEARLFFNKDIYNRDEAVLKALNGPVTL